MNASTMKHAAVLGAGTMGHGIAQVLAMAGLETRVFDIDETAVRRGLDKVRKNLDKGIERGKVSEAARDQAVELLSGTTDLAQAVAEVDVVIEAAPERMELKRSLFEKLGELTGEDTLLATNTSSLAITAIAEASGCPERVTGMHFFNPVHIMKLVEVVRTPHSSDAAVEASVELAGRIGKDPISVVDSPGFASSRLGLVLGLEAIRMVEQKVASAEDIDKAMTLGYGHPMGPLRLTDLVGLDVRLSIAEYLAGEVGAHFAPPQLLRDMVERGELGKKSGRGFYDWTT